MLINVPKLNVLPSEQWGDGTLCVNIFLSVLVVEFTETEYRNGTFEFSM